MMWIKLLLRLFVFWPLAIIVLPIPTLYATVRKLDRLPWGLDYIFGNSEDGWNGTGCDPDFTRKHWKNVDNETIQGWWPNYLGVIWDVLPWFNRWWFSYQWAALRNVCWNLRMNDWFGASIHFEDIRVVWFEHDQTSGEFTYIWYDKSRRKKYKKGRIIFGRLIEYGYEFYPEYFDRDHAWFQKVRKQGYTFNVAPFKNRSIPSLRLR